MQDPVITNKVLNGLYAKNTYANVNAPSCDEKATAAYEDIVADVIPGKSVLDIGCNTGEYCLESILPMGPSALHGIDVVENCIARAKEKEVPGVTFECKGFYDLSGEKPSSYDTIISRFTLHYADDLEKLFLNIAHVLKPGGELVFLSNMIRCPEGKESIPSDVLANPLVPIRIDETLTVPNLCYPMNQYREAMEKAGFELVEYVAFDANTKIDPSYGQPENIDLRAVVLHARRK